MQRVSSVFGLLVVLALASSLAPAQRGPAETTAEIRITLPDGHSGVSVAPMEDRLVLELPPGARYPSDFAASSGGMLRDGKIIATADSVTIELELALGMLCGRLARGGWPRSTSQRTSSTTARSR